MSEDTKLSASEKKKEDWMNSKWRPMMGWMYMTVCTMDFVIFPILWSLLQSLSHGQVTSQWQPLTLQGAGLFHIAMGGVLGLAAYGRTQEKLNGANNGGINLGPGTTYVPPGGQQGATNAGFSTSSSGASAFGSPSTGGFGAPSSSFGSAPLGGNSASSFATSGFGGSGFGGAPMSGGFGPTPAPMKPVGAPLPMAVNQPTGNPTKTPGAVDNPDA